ncbi:RNase H family protein [Agromyces cerinus]|uniref:ribonuclease H n=1 Tax=Agromyces cerinus subsp. cerinus TaxID=232089 RepID=A0A1N6HSE9_9MICO|nr:RNase H family protein [Agromyces cerinus]SIO22717.1 ribonuclease HI [Agromyces cerinus subsp. cerinus]
MITAAADGSALGNPGPAGWAWYVDDSCWAAGGWKHATNNQGELKAVLELFRATAHLDDELLVQCDSQYVINSVTKWMPGWKRKGWRKADGKAVMNVELLQEIDEAIAGRRYRFEWVKGHIGHPLNEAADTRARAVAEAYQRGREIPAGPGWSSECDDDSAAKAPNSRPAGSIESEDLPDPIDLGAPELELARPEIEPELDDALFSLDEEPEAWHSVRLELSTEEIDRLRVRAQAEGLSPEEFLRRLI